MHFINILAVLSGLFQALGYFFYLRLSLKRHIQPNPLSWIMWAYGTSLILLLEWRTGAAWQELFLPGICSAASIIVAYVSLRDTVAIQRPDHADLFAFCSDILLTLIYVMIWWLARIQIFPERIVPMLGIVLIVCASLTTITSFVPIIRSAIEVPVGEHPLPWGIWTIAYICLTALTVMTGAFSDRWYLLLYPSLGVVLHGAMACVAWQGRNPLHGEHLHIGMTTHTGWGLFTLRAFGLGEEVFRLDGTVRKFVSRTEADALANPNWVGIGRDIWIEPKNVSRFINHSCEPNLGIRDDLMFVALRAISPTEELTFDYSITQDEFLWSMPCKCCAEACRGTIRSIQFLPDHVYRRYLPLIPQHFQDVYEATAVFPTHPFSHHP